MSDQPLVESVANRLANAGYERITLPITIASIEFGFSAVLRGTKGRGLDLVLVVDASTESQSDIGKGKIRHRVEALSRALDLTESRYLLTLILAGVAKTVDAEALSSICRVLKLEPALLGANGVPPDDAGREAFDDSIRMLLPLNLPVEHNAEQSAQFSLQSMIPDLGTLIDGKLIELLSSASLLGAKAVSQALKERVDDVLTTEEGS